jgi:hypothetical protein
MERDGTRRPQVDLNDQDVDKVWDRIRRDNGSEESGGAAAAASESQQWQGSNEEHATYGNFKLHCIQL